MPADRFDYLIVGAGLTGSVLAERIASQLGKRVLVVDRRAHIAGNAHDYHDAHGVLVHEYGPHLFHTNSERVWAYLSRFTAWHPYEHRVLAEVDGRRVPVPFNLTSLRALFPPGQAARLEGLLKARFGEGAKVPILKLREDAASAADLSDRDRTDLRALADFIYEKVFYGYTVKQWGLTPEQLGPTVMARVPVHVSEDDRYFQDTFQALPRDGYAAMVARILDHPHIRVETGVDFREAERTVRFDRLIYTGPIDAFFDHAHGLLPYRSLRFEFVHDASPFFQERAQVNFPNAHPYTRITEFKHATGQAVDGTTVAYEYPQPHVPGENEPYYPIPVDENRALYARYAADAAKLDTVVLAGRLADYQYYNMDQAVARALSVFEKAIARP
ncbi:MAG TPA: UDP-galactopyranose mutase [Rubricoccaceae bacterium]|nr:UDP-galactopyranose mutase [Rubricoccaceae bacterium]